MRFQNGAKECIVWISARAFQIFTTKKYLLANFGFDTAENEPCKVCPLSVHLYPRFLADLLTCANFADSTSRPTIISADFVAYTSSFECAHNGSKLGVFDVFRTNSESPPSVYGIELFNTK